MFGIDTHKDTLACAHSDPVGKLIDYQSIDNTTDGHKTIIEWVTNSGETTVAIEGSGNYGRPLAIALITAGIDVVEVPPQMTATARRGTRTGTKTDPVDALLVAQIALREPELPKPRPTGDTEEIRQIVYYRRELTQQRNRQINRLHSCLEQHRCGYHRELDTQLHSARGLEQVRRMLRGDHSTAAAIARNRINTICRLAREIAALTNQLSALIDDAHTSIDSIDGAGVIVTAEILAETAGRVYPTKAKFAMANGTAPLEASSGRTKRHRLNRGGNRHLNKAIHTIAISQINRPHTEGRHYFDRQLANGKTKREALRNLKRRISDRVWTHLQTQPLLT